MASTSWSNTSDLSMASAISSLRVFQKERRDSNNPPPIRIREDQRKNAA